MASSSSSNSKRFDVFLSFRGEDTRRSFLSHLEKEFERKAINVFKDDRKLQTGDRISDELIRAIEDSKFAVVVISKNYADSGWCLSELEKIMEREEEGELKVVPIFYEVDPSHVRRQEGTFSEAFGKKHDARHSKEKVQKWRDALTKVASLSGRTSKESSTDAELVREIVEDISKRLFSMVTRNYGDKIGMDAHFEALAPLLKMESGGEVCMIGIWGMGGIGKTTIAKCLYKTYQCLFQFHCFMVDVKKNYKDQGKKMLRQQFLSRILRDEKLWSEDIEIDSSTIESRLHDKRVLAILDDVDDLKQVKALAKCTNWFGSGSRIIITTREKALFVAHGINLVYEVKCLRDDAALELFNRSAFRDASIENQVSDDFKKLSHRALELVKGHPLAIKVLGNDLRGKAIGYWELVVQRLEGKPREEVMECLQVSYDGLGKQDKDNLLVIACLFLGEDKRRLAQLLDGEGGELSLTRLAEKALIDVSRYGQVTMHDLIQEMAKDIVRQQSNNEPERQRFLWNPAEIYDVLEDGSDADAIQGISLDMSEMEDFPVRTKSFGNMRNLKYLVIRGTSCYRGDLSELRTAIDHLPRKLKLLDWEHCPLTTLPPAFEAKCLVDLRLTHSDIEKFSERAKFGMLRRLEVQSCLHLKQIPKQLANIVELNLSWTKFRELPEIPNLATLEVLDLSFCEMLLEIPNTISNLTVLKDLKVRGCKELASIPDTIGNLAALEALDLYGCRKLTEIPTSIGNLTTLRKLELSRCKKLRSVPDTVGSLSILEELGLNDCTMLLEIPSTLGNLSLVEKLRLGNCKSVRRIPDLIGNFTALRHIMLECKMLSELSSTIGNITTLRWLWLKDCQNLKSIPSTIGNLSSLEELHLLNCPMLIQIPSRIGDLRALKDLRIENCEMLRNIPETIRNLSSLEELHLLDCPMLIQIPSTIGDLRALKDLHIENCEMLRNIPETIGNLSSLGELCFSRCPKLSEIPTTIGDLRALNDLLVNDCEMLGNIPETIGNLTSLRKLCLSSFPKLTKIPSTIGNLRALNDLHIEDCEMLGNIPDTIGKLTSLGKLRLSSCPMLAEIPSIIGNLRVLNDMCIKNCKMLGSISDTIGNLTFLGKFRLSGCPTLMEIPSTIGNLRALNDLCIKNCEMLRNIPDTIGNMISLGKLRLSGCPTLAEIPSTIGDLRALSDLCIENCEMLGNIPYTIGNLTSLRSLRLLDCPTLAEIPSTIGDLKALNNLCVKNCKMLGNIPNTIGNLTSLGKFRLSDCPMLAEIPSTIGDLRALNDLRIKNCEMLRNIPDTIGNLTSLKKLNLSDCPMLTEIPSTIGDLRGLKDLQIENCKMLENIPNIVGNLTSLRGLCLSGYTMVVEVPSWIGNLKALGHLSIKNCEKLRKFPDTIENLTALESLNLSGCFMLCDVPSIIKNLPSLKYLSPPEDIDCFWEIMKECCSRKIRLENTLTHENDMEGEWEIAPGNQVVQVLRLFRQRYEPNHMPFRCTRLSIFPYLRKLSLRSLNIMEIPDDLGYLQVLQHLDLSGNDFEILPASIQQLPLLEQLELRVCSKIQSIPELPPGLKHLFADHCSSLESITNVYGHLFRGLSLDDCFKLGLNLLQQYIQHMILATPIHKGEIKTWACFSASELPDCFSYQSTGQRLRIPCSQIDSGFKPVGFVTGILISRNGLLDVSSINICCWLRGEGYQTRQICFDYENSLFLGHTSHSDLLVVLSYNFGEEKYLDEISFHLNFKNRFPKKHKIKKCGTSLCFTKELQQGQSVLPLTGGIGIQDIGELVEEGNFSNLKSADQS